MFRSLLERLVRNRTIRRRLPKRFQRTQLFLSPDAQLRFLVPGTGAFDATLLRIAEEEISGDSVVWDIGANCGVFAFAAAAIAVRGSVLAVEPDVWLAALLRRTAALKGNAHLHVQVLPAAISNANGTAAFQIARRGRASNSLESVNGRSQAGGVRERVVAPTLTLDTLLNSWPAPTFVKIDIEGAEALALQGATRLLSSIRPMLYVEVGSAAVDEVSAILEAYRYAIYDGSASKQKRGARKKKCPWNTIAVPDA